MKMDINKDLDRRIADLIEVINNYELESQNVKELIKASPTQDISDYYKEREQELYSKIAYFNSKIQVLISLRYQIRIPSPDFTNEKELKSIELATIDDLFSLRNRIQVLIDIDREQLELIQSDNCNEQGVRDGRKPKIYRKANSVTFIINAFEWTLKNVGIRQRGNTSRNDIFIDGEINPQNHFKLSFDETFDNAYPENKDRTLFGMDSIDIKWNKSVDLTHIREIYASRMYRAASCIYQHIGLCEMKMNGTSFGLCNIYESSGKNMLKLAMQSDSKYINMATWKTEKKGKYGLAGANYGDYYKIQYGVGEGYRSDMGGDMSLYSISEHRVGVQTDPFGRQVPAFERKTNKKELDYDDGQLKQFVIEQKLPDLHYFAIEEAVSFFVGNPDSWMYNYNNLKIYFRRIDGQMITIPIDNDRAFGIGETWKGGLDFVYDEKLSPFTLDTIWGEDNRNHVFINTISSKRMNLTKSIFINAINSLINSGWLNNENFLKLYEIAKKTYLDYEFKLKNGDNVSFEEFVTLKIKAFLSAIAE